MALWRIKSLFKAQLALGSFPRRCNTLSSPLGISRDCVALDMESRSVCTGIAQSRPRNTHSFCRPMYSAMSTSLRVCRPVQFSMCLQRQNTKSTVNLGFHQGSKSKPSSLPRPGPAVKGLESIFIEIVITVTAFCCSLIA